MKNFVDKDCESIINDYKKQFEEYIENNDDICKKCYHESIDNLIDCDNCNKTICPDGYCNEDIYSCSMCGGDESGYFCKDCKEENIIDCEICDYKCDGEYCKECFYDSKIHKCNRNIRNYNIDYEKYLKCDDEFEIKKMKWLDNIDNDELIDIIFTEFIPNTRKGLKGLESGIKFTVNDWKTSHEIIYNTSSCFAMVMACNYEHECYDEETDEPINDIDCKCEEFMWTINWGIFYECFCEFN